MTGGTGWDWDAIEKDKRFIKVEKEIQKLEDAGCNVHTGECQTERQLHKLNDLNSERDRIIESYPDMSEMDYMFGVKPSKDKLL
ncbi:MAG: hypothetical protein MPK62_01235 [Alphaproteobacteria bacterium]|nr:hypothetical protein [Alphaproteobacteria bacterium]MDA8029759.1 hypothetical protein [Alphaproteobacteria bacterium]